MERRGHSRIEIKETEDFNFICDDILSEWLDGFTEEEGLIREPDQEDIDEFDGLELSYMFTKKGMRLYDSACSKMSRLGLKHFPEEELDIKSSAMLHP